MIDLTKFTKEELIDLNRKIVDQINFLECQQAANLLTKFKKFDFVSFIHDGREIECFVEKINKKTLSVITEDKNTAKVPPSFVKIIETPSKKIQRVKEHFYPDPEKLLNKVLKFQQSEQMKENKKRIKRSQKQL